MNCKQGAILLIDQIVDTIGLIPENDFSRPLEVFNGSTLGKHFRHICDFFSCIIEQCQCNKLDYADRHRDPIIEQSKTHAIRKFESLRSQIAKLDESQIIEVYADFELPNGERPKVRTSVGRELMYGYDHAVHHLAIVKIGLKSIDPNLPINEKMGVAASTIQHQYSVLHGH